MLAVASLAAPLAAVALLSAAGWLEGHRVIASGPVRAWAIAASVALLGAWVRAGLERRVDAVLGLAAAACAALHLVVSSAWRLDGTVDAGEGEESPLWRSLDAGPAADPPYVRLVALPEAPAAPARVKLGETEVTVPSGAQAELAGGLIVHVSEPFPAPAFEVRRASGDPEAAGLLKLHPGERTWFGAGILPHRFYAAPVEGAGGDARVRLAVQRGKLKIAERELAFGEALEVEGVSVSFGPGSRWARIHVRRVAPRWPAAAAAALGLASVVAWARRRRA
jgi:hypothetical protein